MATSSGSPQRRGAFPASRRCRECSPLSAGSRRFGDRRLNLVRCRSTTPTSEVARSRRGCRSTRPQPRLSTEASSVEARACRDPVDAQDGRVPLSDARSAGDRRARTPGTVPGREDALWSGVLAAQTLRDSSGLSQRGLGRHTRVRLRTRRTRDRVAVDCSRARVPRCDRTAWKGVRLSEAADELPAHLRRPRGGIRLLPRAGAARAPVALEERMGCGFGLCFSCVVPVARKDGSGYDNVRSCVDGPVFNPARVLWDRWLSDSPTMLPTPPEGLPVVHSWPG